MAHKIAIAITLLALFGGAYAATVTMAPTASSFVFAPTASYDTSKSPDSSYHGWGAGVMYGNSSDTAYAYLYLVGKDVADFSGTNFRLFRRKLFSANFTTIGTSGDDSSVTPGTVPLLTPVMMSTATDQVAWAAVDATAKTVVACSAKSSATFACLTSVAEALAPTLYTFWCDPQTGNCYAGFTDSHAATPTWKIMGITSAGAQLWTAAKSTTVGAQGFLCLDNAMVIWGNYSNQTSTIINIAYRDCTAATAAGGNTKYNSIKVADGTLTTATASAVVVVTNTAATKVYKPCGGYTTNSSHGLILCYADTTTAGSEVYNLTHVLNPATKTSFAATDLQYLNVTSIKAPFVSASGSYHGSGFFLISTAGATTSWTTYYNTYNGTGFNSSNGGLTLATHTDSGVPRTWWITANGTLCWGFGAYDSTPARVTGASAGAIVLNVWSTSGNVLASFVAFVALMIASLFAF